MGLFYSAPELTRGYFIVSCKSVHLFCRHYS